MKVRLDFTAITPMLMHSDVLADPLNPLTKEMKRFSSKRTKTDEDHEKMASLEFAASIYRDQDGEIVVPAANVKKCLIEGARVNKSGPKIERGVTLLGVNFPLSYGTTKKSADELFSDAAFVDRRSVKVGQTKVMRVRPVFNEWALTVEAFIDPAICSVDDLSEIAQNAGNLIGLGDHRKVGGYGRFDAKVSAL